MNVKELCRYLRINEVNNNEINNIVTSTKDVKNGDVLICVKGHNVDPTNLITSDIESKCSLILTDQINSKYQYVENLKDKVFNILDYYYFNHRHKFKMIAITGTEGKSSLAQLIQQSLFLENKKAMIISTELSNKYAFKFDNTTPDAKSIIDVMLQAKKSNVDYLILEVSSIAISEKRVSPNIFDYIFLTNLEEDHLDYHKNIFSYHKEKISLLLNNTKAKKFVFADTYNKYPNFFVKIKNMIIIDKKDIKVKNSSLNKQSFYYKDKLYFTHLVFKQNIYNLVFIIEFLKSLNIYSATKTISKLRRIKGRLDLIYSRPYIMIDYAHSPKALENILLNVTAFKQNRILVLFGAGGNRDNKKRRRYGDILYKYADKIYLTNDNPRNEDPLKIALDVKGSYIEKFEIVLNRKDAIKQIINESNIDDIILILGRGNEEYQHINNQHIYLNDYAETYRCLGK